MKTGEEFVTPILPYTQKILERNNFHLSITSNQKYNQFLKGIGIALGCSFPLTAHIARYTFACTISLGEGISKEVLQVMMGHSSIKTTELYAKMPMEFVANNVQKCLFNVWKQRLIVTMIMPKTHPQSSALLFSTVPAESLLFCHIKTVRGSLIPHL